MVGLGAGGSYGLLPMIPPPISSGASGVGSVTFSGLGFSTGGGVIGLSGGAGAGPLGPGRVVGAGVPPPVTGGFGYGGGDGLGAGRVVGGGVGLGGGAGFGAGRVVGAGVGPPVAGFGGCYGVPVYAGGG